MARPRSKELTERELEVMHVFWSLGEATIADVRDALAESGLVRAHTTIATLVKILSDKGFLKTTRFRRPTQFKPARSYKEVSGKLLDQVVERVFQGSSQLLLVRLLERKKLGDKERRLLEEIIKGGGQ